MAEIDELDRAILAELECNARASISELARRLGAPSSTIRDRLRSLEQTGVILGYTAVVDPIKLGLNIKAIIHVTRDQSVSLDDLRVEPLRLAEVTAVQLTTGETDALITVHARDVAHLKEIIYNKVGALPGVTHLNTAIVLEERTYPVVGRCVDRSAGASVPESEP